MCRKTVTRMFSLLLSVLMFACSYMAVPAEVLAEGLAVREAVREYNEANDFSGIGTMEYSALLGEEEELRGEATRTFRRGDGMKEAVVYSEPVAYETEDGYALIDNTLIRTEEGYTNKANSLKAAFAEDTEKEELVRLEAGGSLLSWFLGGFHMGEAPEEVMEEETVPEEETIPAEEDFSEDKIPSVSWQNAEQAVRNLNGGTKATFNTPYGNRVVDSFNKVGQIAREVKYGYQGLSLRLKIEILKDQFLLGQNNFNKVEWHFYRSVVSNTVGASKNLLKALDNAGIQHITHK